MDRTDPGLLRQLAYRIHESNDLQHQWRGQFRLRRWRTNHRERQFRSISGIPATGDQFTIEANYGASGDNANALLMVDVQSVGVLDGGSISINQSYTQLVSGVGATTHQIQSNLQAQEVVLTNAEDAVLSMSAVNLDEEAANLIKFQQAYQAVAQVVAVASTLFDSLLNATRR